MIKIDTVWNFNKVANNTKAIAIEKMDNHKEFLTLEEKQDFEKYMQKMNNKDFVEELLSSTFNECKVYKFGPIMITKVK